VSHFVYLGFNHRRQRNICTLELELQSEVDRILLAFHPEAPEHIVAHKAALLSELRDDSYDASKPDYETSRKWAARLIRSLASGDPSAWSKQDQALLREFFHRDLSEKIHLLGKVY